MFFGDVDRLRQDIDLPVTHTLSYKSSTIFCASCGCCSHSGARYASKTICLDFEWVLLFLYGHSCLFCGLGYKGCSNVGCKINGCWGERMYSYGSLRWWDAKKAQKLAQGSDSKAFLKAFRLFFLWVSLASLTLFFFQAEPPAIVVATVASLCHMLEKHILRLDSVKVLVVDEVKTP